MNHFPRPCTSGWPLVQKSPARLRGQVCATRRSSTTNDMSLKVGEASMIFDDKRVKAMICSLLAATSAICRFRVRRQRPFMKTPPRRFHNKGQRRSTTTRKAKLPIWVRWTSMAGRRTQRRLSSGLTRERKECHAPMRGAASYGRCTLPSLSGFKKEKGTEEIGFTSLPLSTRRFKTAMRIRGRVGSGLDAEGRSCPIANPKLRSAIPPKPSGTPRNRTQTPPPAAP